LPFFGKVLERLILNRILPIIHDKQILPEYQFGFWAKHSTIHQVHKVVDAISFPLEKNFFVRQHFSMYLRLLIECGMMVCSTN